MRIEGSIQPTPLRNSVGQNRIKTERKSVPTRDSFEPSDPTSRKLALYSIKEKVKAGYYSSDRVAEDISDKLARIFDET